MLRTGCSERAEAAIAQSSIAASASSESGLRAAAAHSGGSHRPPALAQSVASANGCNTPVAAPGRRPVAAQGPATSSQVRCKPDAFTWAFPLPAIHP
eukprot:scaffold147818_cov27-Tisochrysis_lutea.AAC.4